MVHSLLELDMAGPAMEMMTVVVMATVAKLVGLSVVARSQRQKFQQIGRVASLYLYPVKSCGVMETAKAECTPVGLKADGLTDRHWTILDENDKPIDMKAQPRLTMVTATSLDDTIRLDAPGMPSLELPKCPDLKKSKVEVKVFIEQKIPFIDCGKEAANWITEYAKRPARIVFSCPDLGVRDAFERIRKWDNSARKGDVTVFAFLTSYMMTSTASLRNINSQLEQPVAMVNFRPNIVIDNDIPFDEDNWKEIRIGDHTLFHTVEPCRRCLITTVNPKTGEFSKNRQPLDLLRSFRCREPYGKSPIFGQYFSNDVSGHIRVGDPVYVLKD